jgi:hypothetical protein
VNAQSIPFARFRLGRIVATPNAVEQISSLEITQAIARHQSGDWGDIGVKDRQKNETALLQGLRIIPVYHSGKNLKFWVVTEADRSITTILLPADY